MPRQVRAMQQESSERIRRREWRTLGRRAGSQRRSGSCNCPRVPWRSARIPRCCRGRAVRWLLISSHYQVLGAGVHILDDQTDAALQAAARIVGVSKAEAQFGSSVGQDKNVTSALSCRRKCIGCRLPVVHELQLEARHCSIIRGRESRRRPG